MSSSDQRINSARQHGAMEFSDPPTDLDKVRLYRQGRLREQLKKHDYAGMLLFDQINTRYACDATNMQVWCAHYETRCVFLPAEGPCVVFDYSNHPYLAEGLPTVDEYRVMPSFYYFTAGSRVEERVKDFAGQIADLMREHGGSNNRLAIDRLSHQGVDAIRSHGIEVLDALPLAEHARVIKSPEELALMQVSMDVCEKGMQAMRDAMRPGITENALWAKLHETNIALGGEWIETRLLSSGPRTNPWFRECSMREIEGGDLVCFDTDLIGPYGYCSDVSRSWLCGDGKPNDDQRRLYAAAHSQIEHNVNLLKPGMTFREVSEKSWKIPEEYQSRRYSSMIHGVGLADEYPSIKFWVDFDKKGYDGMLEPGMTLCVESFIGVEGGKEGVKLEEQVIINEDGVTRMSSYPFELEFL